MLTYFAWELSMASLCTGIANVNPDGRDGVDNRDVRVKKV